MTGFTEEHREQLEWAADAMSFSDAYPSLAEALTAALSALDARDERIRELEEVAIQARAVRELITEDNPLVRRHAVAELDAALASARAGDPPQPDARDERIRELEEALKVIRDHGTKEGHDCWALHQGDCADLFQETARAALRSDTAPHEGQTRRIRSLKMDGNHEYAEGQTRVNEGGTDG